MNETKQNILVASAIALAVAVVGGVGLMAARTPQAPVVNAPVTVQPAPVQVLPSENDGNDQVLGGLIHNIQESFDAGIAVKGTQIISASRAVSSTNLTVGSYNTPLNLRKTITSSASSQTLCSFENDTGRDLVLSNVGVIYATNTATGGLWRVSISQSSTASATGTGSNIYYDEAFSVPTNGLTNLNTTSTLLGYSGTGGTNVTSTQALFRSGYYLNYLIATPTSTGNFTCSALVY